MEDSSCRSRPLPCPSACKLDGIRGREDSVQLPMNPFSHARLGDWASMFVPTTNQHGRACHVPTWRVIELSARAELFRSEDVRLVAVKDQAEAVWKTDQGAVPIRLERELGGFGCGTTIEWGKTAQQLLGERADAGVLRAS